MTREEFVDRWSQGFPGLAEEPFEFERDLDALLDSERAKAREEQREVDRLWVVDVLSTRGSAFDLWQTRERHAGTMQSTLTSTPLADRIAVLEKDRALLDALLDRTTRERDEARQRIAELERSTEGLKKLLGAAYDNGARAGMEARQIIERERDEARARAEKAETQRDGARDALKAVLAAQR